MTNHPSAISNPSTHPARALSRLTPTSALLLAHALLLIAVAPRKGADSLWVVLFQSGCATVSLLMLLYAHRCDERPLELDRWHPRLGTVLVWSGLLFAVFGNTGYGAHRWAMLPVRLACLPLLAVYFLPHVPPPGSMLAPLYRYRRQVFVLLCVIAVGLRIAALFISPEPEIDVFWFTNQGAEGILQGIDPYARAYHVIDPHSEFLYAYLPGQFLFDVPARGILGDMRWGQVLLELTAAVLIYRLVMGYGRSASRRHTAELMALLLLFFPQVLRMQEQSWVEFKQVFGILLFIWLLVRWPTRWYAWAALGLLFSLKQTAWAAVPFLKRIRTFGVGPALTIAGVMTALIVPFVLWDPYAFYDDIVLYHVGLPLPHSTSLSWAWALATGHEPGMASVALTGGLVFAWLWWTGRRTLLSFLIAAAALGMLPVLMRQAFLNYYYAIDGILLTALAWTLRRQFDREEGLESGFGEGLDMSATRGELET